MRISWNGRRRQALIAGVGLVAAVAAAVAVLASGDDAEVVASGRAPAPTAATTTTPPEVLGDVTVREPARTVTGTATEDVGVPAAPVETTVPATAPATIAPTPAPSPATTRVVPVTTIPPTTAVPATEPTAIEVRRAPDGPEMSVLLLRDGTAVGSGTLVDTLRFDDLVPGTHVLQVEFETGTVVDEQTGATISGHSAARYEVAAGAGLTVVTCSSSACAVD